MKILMLTILLGFCGHLMADTDPLDALPKEHSAEAQTQEEPKTSILKGITYDFNVGSRFVGDSISIEAALGFNFYFLKWLSLREAVFYHQLGSQNSLGLDSSLEGSYTIGNDIFRFTPSLGAGYRIETIRMGTPFAEGGISLHLGRGISFSISAKRLFYSLIDKSQDDETIISIGGNLAGGGRIL